MTPRGYPPTPFARWIGTPPDDAAFASTWQLCRRAWRERGLIVASVEQLPEQLRGPMREWARAEYGERT